MYRVFVSFESGGDLTIEKDAEIEARRTAGAYARVTRAIAVELWHDKRLLLRYERRNGRMRLNARSLKYD